MPACKGRRPPKPVVTPPPTTAEPQPPALAEPETPGLTLKKDERYARIDSIARQEITSGGFPGAVILVGNQGNIVYRKAFGYRSVSPQQQPMTENTIFDIASLTKVVATTTAVMRLVDAKLIKLDDPVGKYLPEFKCNGKSSITIKQLLTHTSGLRADVNPKCSWAGSEGAVGAISQDQPVRPPGSSFIYSDGNFIILAELVHRVTRTPFDVYCKEKIFKPLGMRRTSFRPPGSWQALIAPTDIQGNRLRWGEVSDPTANRMGGVAGNAGVFSTADDLAILVQMILNGGAIQGKRILSPQAVAAMTKPYNVSGSFVQRGLGWDLISPYSKEHNAAFPHGSFGHTGYTGTSMWVDPRSKTFLIILTSRLHPDGRGQVKQLRARVAGVVADTANLGPPARVADWSPEEIADAGFGASDTPARVQPGIEVLASSDYAPLKGKRLGVITNHSGIDSARRSTVALLRRAPGVKVQAIFSPEHGLSGKLDEKVSSGLDPQSGLPVYSLYGENKKPSQETLRGLDALVYDIQDVGARFYTYITTMAYAMEAAAANGLEFYVLDRPNPITAAVVQGPVMDRSLKSFIGYYPLPVRYGMTPGEVAQLYNREAGIGAKLQVIPMKGYRRDAWFDQTKLPWVDPSPNLRNLTQSTLYCGVGIVESCNVSVGRGTPMPFEVLGAPWISGSRLADYLQKRNIPGVKIEPVTFVPTSNRYCGQSCQGVRFSLTDRNNFDAPLLGVELASALHRLYPGKFQFINTASMIGSREVVQAIKDGDDPRQISRNWQAGLNSFLQKRQKYLLY
ncbi:MAG: exo-beta-N-acetylmuramidase NamZ domain-containing protein [Desulfobaccales bacterium]